MAIKEAYEVYCDKCGVLMNKHYNSKPNINQIREYSGKTYIKGSKIITLCKSCAELMNKELF